MDCYRLIYFDFSLARPAACLRDRKSEFSSQKEQMSRDLTGWRRRKGERTFAGKLVGAYDSRVSPSSVYLCVCVCIRWLRHGRVVYG